MFSGGKINVTEKRGSARCLASDEGRVDFPSNL
jgi:hypothetical protein